MDEAGAPKRKLDWQFNGEKNSEALPPAEKLQCRRDEENTRMTADEVLDAKSGQAGEPVETPMVTTPALLALMQRTGYAITQENGQRKYGGPPPGWENKAPPRGTEVFVGKIPRDVFEDELVPVFETAGKIYELRLMMDFDGKNRGYAFVMFTTKSEAKGAVKKLNNYEIRKGRLLGVCYSVDNCRLFVGGIPKSKKKEDIFTEMTKVTEGVVDVIVYPSASDKSKNRGFAFVQYDSHRAAAMARRKLIPGRIQLWGHPIAVDWAEPEQEVDQEIMDQVKVLYVRNLMLETTEDTLQEIFSQFAHGCVERVKKIRDYAFVHFSSRETCIEAMKKINGTKIDDAEVEVTLAKPVDKSDWNRMAKVGAKVLAQTGTEGNTPPAVVQSPAVVNPNGMIMYPSAVYGTELAYQPLNQYNLATGSRPIRGGSMRNERGRGTVGSRPNNSRNSYLGYSAGKATYGRYYSKNNQERPGVIEVNGAGLEILTQQALISGQAATSNINEHSLPAMYKHATTALSTIAAPGQAINPYAPTTVTQIPGMQQVIPTVIPQKLPENVLEEVCQRQMWGVPTYQLLTTTTPDNRQLFLYKVSIPALANLFPQQPFFQPNKLCVTIEEAKSFAAEYVLSQLALQADGSPAVVPVPAVLAPPAPTYQFAQPATIQLRSSPTSAASTQHAAAYVPVTTPSPTIPIPFVDHMGQPIAVMYQ